MENLTNPIKMSELVNYQEKSIVSKTIIEKKSGIITLFAFDEGQGLSEHTSSFDALVNILDGEAEIVISGKSFHIKEGEMVIMPADKPHALRAIKRFKMVLTQMR